MEQSHDENVAQTYLALRVAMVMLVALLLLSVAFHFIGSGCLQHSISAFYYTPTRPIFVGMLCAIGACLVIYRGNTDTENVLLNFCGFLAFVVAFVPTGVDKTCASINVPTPGEVREAAVNNVSVLIVIGAVVAATNRILLHTREVQPLNAKARRWAVGSTLALAAGAVIFALQPDDFIRIGHNTAAATMFAGIVVVVFHNAYEFERFHASRRLWRIPLNRYGVVAALMLVTLISVPLVDYLSERFDHWVFVIEALLIIEFAVFWGLQTQELRGDVTRAQTFDPALDQ